MPLSRREFLTKSGILAVGLTLTSNDHNVRPVPAVPRSFFNPRSLARFVDPLPIPSIARSTGMRPDRANHKALVPYYRIAMTQFEAPLHRDLQPTKLWGFSSSVPGPTFNARKGAPFLVEWVNALPLEHLFPIDHNLHGAEAGNPDVRTVVHVHGARTPPESDGYPERWYTSGQSAVFYYPNEQEAATLWYHDHAMGINRLNIYAGLFGFFIIRDEAEDKLSLPADRFDVPLIICDRLLDAKGQIYYPVSTNPRAPWLPEIYGNTILVNNKIYPYLDVEPRKYRIRLLNAANTRSFILSFSNAMPFYQIGTDLGLLPSPVRMQALLLYPAERADVIVDFNGLEGKQIVLKNRALDLMQLRVSSNGRDQTPALPKVLRQFSR
jgi:spore coat protein A